MPDKKDTPPPPPDYADLTPAEARLVDLSARLRATRVEAADREHLAELQRLVEEKGIPIPSLLPGQKVDVGTERGPKGGTRLVLRVVGP